MSKNYVCNTYFHWHLYNSQNRRIKSFHFGSSEDVFWMSKNYVFNTYFNWCLCNSQNRRIKKIILALLKTSYECRKIMSLTCIFIDVHTTWRKEKNLSPENVFWMSRNHIFSMRFRWLFVHWVGSILWGTWMSIQTSMAINWIAFEIF